MIMRRTLGGHGLHLLDGCDPVLGRGHAREGAEVAVEVRLVVVAAVERDVDQVGAGAQPLRAPARSAAAARAPSAPCPAHGGRSPRGAGGSSRPRRASSPIGDRRRAGAATTTRARARPAARRACARRCTARAGRSARPSPARSRAARPARAPPGRSGRSSSTTCRGQLAHRHPEQARGAERRQVRLDAVALAGVLGAAPARRAGRPRTSRSCGRPRRASDRRR